MSKTIEEAARDVCTALQHIIGFIDLAGDTESLRWTEKNVPNNSMLRRARMAIAGFLEADAAAKTVYIVREVCETANGKYFGSLESAREYLKGRNARLKRPLTDTETELWVIDPTEFFASQLFQIYTRELL